MIDWDKHVLAPTVGVFGEKVVYLPVAGAPFDILGVYDEAYKLDVEFGDGSVGATSTKPMVGTRLSQFANPPVQNDKLYVPRIDQTFIVVDPRADSHGWVKLILNKADP